MKVIVYLPIAEERELEAAGYDPARWVRDVVKAALSERGAQVPEAATESGGSSASSGSGRVKSTPGQSPRSVNADAQPRDVVTRTIVPPPGDHFKPDFKGEKKQKK